MKLSRHHNKLVFTIFGIIIIGGIYWMVTDNGQNAGAFRIPPPLQFPNALVECTFKQTGVLYDSSGKQYDVQQSTALTDNPIYLSLINLAGIDIAGFVVQPKIKCDFPDGEYNLIIDASELGIIVQSKDNTGKKIQTTYQMVTDTTTLTFSNNEEIIATGAYSFAKVKNKLPAGNYNSLQEVGISGYLKMHYDSIPSAPFYLVISPVDVRVYYELRMFEAPPPDADGDGIYDVNDQCPNDKEDFLGTVEGCPESTVPTLCTNPEGTYSCNQQYRDAFCNGSFTCPSFNTPDPSPPECSTGEILVNGFCIQESPIECADIGGVGYTLIDGVCVPPELNPDPTPDSINGEIAFSVDIIFNDGTNQALLASHDPSPFPFTLSQTSIIGGVKAGDTNRKISSITITPFVRFDDQTTFNRMTLNEVAGSITSTISIKGGTIPISTTFLDGFFKTSGSGKNVEFGIPMGFITIRSVDIEGTIPASVVPIGSGVTPFTIEFVTSGTMELIYNNEGILETYSDVSFSGADLTMNKLSIIRGTPVIDNGGGTSIPTCKDDERPKAFSTTDIRCVKIGATESDEDPQIGEAGVEICTDVQRIGGFPCTPAYRTEFCQGTTICSLPPDVSDGDKETCPDSVGFLDLTNQCIKIPDDPEIEVGGTTTCPLTIVLSSCIEPPADNTIFWMIGLGGLVLGVLIFAVKRRG